MRPVLRDFRFFLAPWTSVSLFDQYLPRDEGETWEGPNLIRETYFIRGQLVELPDGTVLAPVYGAADKSLASQAAVFASHDKGFTWEPYAFVTDPIGERRRADEPTLFRTASGRIFCFVRCGDGMHYCHSDDDGRTFGELTKTDLPSSVPYHALQLSDGRVYLSYGHRKPPYGVRAMLLDGECNGILLDNEFILRDDGLGVDLSYNSAAILPNGDILSVYYFYTEENDQRRHIAGTLVRL